ncbi:hypothetical protein NDR87_34240 [Nocardia sp. CDC159]|uniref:Uncharacterized protein n=1 Tax=Nocardia pulmonis TaxID=2951408 RepID=A0A9X2J1X5_9NOCA|nr:MULTISPECIES: hypothetical protein [Nocardia]MCM6778555.1 hypothetical protein [Nocardia pulmonis]MCM6791444.1 hypothetical protein [Nocardia sp. CDC159]
MPVIMAGVAGAEVEPPSVDVVAGKNWLVVSVKPNSSDRPEWCRVDPYAGTPQTDSLAVAPSGNLFVDNVPPGTHQVWVWCPNGGTTKKEVRVG